MPKVPPPPVPDEGISLFDDDDDRTEISQPGELPFQKESPKAEPQGGISLDDDDDDRTQIEKKPGPR